MPFDRIRRELANKAKDEGSLKMHCASCHGTSLSAHIVYHPESDSCQVVVSCVSCERPIPQMHWQVKILEK